MRSVVTFLVEHGETTDPLTQLIDDAFFVKGADVHDYTLNIDVSDVEADSALQYTENLHTNP
jgi:hypothetical protein